MIESIVLILMMSILMVAFGYNEPTQTETNNEYTQCETLNGTIIEVDNSFYGGYIKVEDLRYGTTEKHRTGMYSKDYEIDESVLVKVCTIYNKDNEVNSRYQEDYIKK